MDTKAIMLHISKNLVVEVEVHVSTSCVDSIGHVGVAIEDNKIVKKDDANSERGYQHYDYKTFDGKTPKARLKKAYRYTFNLLNKNYSLKWEHAQALEKLFEKLA